MTVVTLDVCILSGESVHVELFLCCCVHPVLYFLQYISHTLLVMITAMMITAIMREAAATTTVKTIAATSAVATIAAVT